MALDLSKLRQRIEARKPKRPQSKSFVRGPKAPPPEPLVKRQEEQRALLEAALERQRRRLARFANEHPPLAKYLRILSRELPETFLVEPGLVDLDLHHVITGLGVDKLPPDVRVAALTETHQWIRQVHKKCTRSTDITPYKRLFSDRFVDSLSEARNALRLI